MSIPFETTAQEAVKKRLHLRPWLMTTSFLVYTLLIVAGHIAGFPLAYAHLQTVCPDGCGLTPDNVLALERHGLFTMFYANVYMTIQLLYILVSVGVALLIVFKKPGEWVPLGVGAFLVGFSAFEGADYPAMIAAHPVLDVPLNGLLFLGMGVLGTYALLTFPNGTIGSRWVLGFYLLTLLEGLLALFITTPFFVQVNDVFSTISFPIILSVLIYRYRRLLNAKERAAIKWLIVSWSVFIVMLILFTIVEAIRPADSLLFLLSYTIGFFGCGINIAGFLMAVLYANAFDIDVFVRRVLVYGMLTISLALIYAGLVIGLGAMVRLLTGELGASPVVVVVSTLAIAALFQPLRRRLQAIIDRRFYRRKYDAAKTLEEFSTTLRNGTDMEELSKQLVAVVQETMQPSHVSLWLRPPASASKQQKAWNSTPTVLSAGGDKGQL